MPPDGYVPVQTRQANATADVAVIFREPFEEGLGNWTSLSESDDTPGSTGWEGQVAIDAYDGTGVVQIKGYEDDPDQCVRKNKLLASPVFPVSGFERVFVIHYFRFLDSRGNVIAPSVSCLPNGWRKSIRELTAAELAFGNVQLFFRFDSPADSCSVEQLDAVTVVGVNGPLPNTIITQPRENGGVAFLEPGQEVAFKAQGTGQGDLTFFWELFTGENNRPEACFIGQEFDFSFQEAGRYRVVCTAVDANGLQDPSPPSRSFIVTTARSLDTVITEPQENPISIGVGESINFEASAVVSEKHRLPDGVTFLWARVANDANGMVEEFAGQSVQIPFAERGRYTVLCFARDANGFRDPSPAVRLVDVRGTGVRITEPDRRGDHRPINIGVGGEITFRGVIEDPAQQVSEFGWILNPGDQVVCANQLDCKIKFDEAGRFGVLFAARGEQNQLDFDLVLVNVGQPVEMTIDSPEENAEIPINTPFQLRGSVFLNQVLVNHEATRIAWVLGDQVRTFPAGEEPVVDLPGIGTPGHYQARLIVMNKALKVSRQERVNFLIYDSDQTVLPKITNPHTDWNLPAGRPLFFDSSLRNIRNADRNVFWEISDQSSGEVIVTRYGATFGRYAFSDAGTYLVSLFLQNNDETRFADSVVVTVGQSLDIPDPATPVAVKNGFYPDIPFGETRFQINVPRDGLTGSFVIDVESDAQVTVLDADGGIVFERLIQGKLTFQLSSLPAGDYQVVVKAVSTGAKSALSFSFGVNVLNPTLFFPDIVEDGEFSTTLGIVNPNGESAEVDIIAYNREGEILEKINRVLDANGSVSDQVLNLFGTLASEIAWIRVDSTLDVVGYTRAVDLKDSKAYAVSAAKQLFSELFVPHIAKDTATFFTDANVVNGKTVSDVVYLRAGSLDVPLENQSSNSSNEVDFLGLFSGTIPDDGTFGSFANDSQDAGLAGNEIFGTVDGTDQVVGLGLAGSPSDNPNFNAITNTLYFTHVADPNNFWTGIALVNLDSNPQDIAVKAYGSGGVLLGEGVIEDLETKRVWIASDFFAEAGIEGQPEWFELIAGADIVGYELFGSALLPKQQAGLETITEVKKSICMPFVDASGGATHGIAIVNVTDQAAGVTFSLFNDRGEVLEQVDLDTPLAGKEKRIFVLSGLFAEIPLGASWLQVDCESEIVGFELIIGANNEHMSGLVAQ